MKSLKQLIWTDEIDILSGYGNGVIEISKHHDRIDMSIIQRIENRLEGEGFNPSNWELFEIPKEDLYVIRNLKNSVEFTVKHQLDGSLSAQYAVQDGYAMQMIEAKSITEAIELGELPK